MARALHGRGSCSTECATFPSDGFHLQKNHLPKSEQCSRPVHNTCANGNTLITTAGTLLCVCVCGGGGSVCLYVTCIECVLCLSVCACMRVCVRTFVFRRRTNLLQERDRETKSGGGGGGQNERDREGGAKSEGQRERETERQTVTHTVTETDEYFTIRNWAGTSFDLCSTKKIHRSPSGSDKRAGWRMGGGEQKA